MSPVIPCFLRHIFPIVRFFIAEFQVSGTSSIKSPTIWKSRRSFRKEKRDLNFVLTSPADENNVWQRDKRRFQRALWIFGFPKNNMLNSWNYVFSSKCAAHMQLTVWIDFLICYFNGKVKKWVQGWTVCCIVRVVAWVKREVGCYSYRGHWCHSSQMVGVSIMI